MNLFTRKKLSGGSYPIPVIAAAITIVYFSTQASATPSVNVSNIQAAIDSATSKQLVFTLSDTYLIEADLEIGDDTSIDLASAKIEAGASAGGDLRLITNKGRPALIGGDGTGNVNIELIGGTIDGKVIGTSTRNIGFYDVVGLNVHGVTSNNAVVHCFEFDDCTDVTANWNIADGCGDDAITPHRCTYGVFNFNTLSGGTGAIGGSHGLEIEDGNKHIAANYNTISDMANGTSTFGGGILIDSNGTIPQASQDSITLIGNVITNCQFNGININNDNGGKTTNIIISGGSITNSGNSAFKAQGCDDFNIKGVVIDGVYAGGNYGVYIKNCNNWQVIGNTIKHSEKEGMFIEGDSCTGFSIGVNTVDSVATTSTFKAAIKINATAQRDIYAEILGNIITNTDGNAQMRKGIEIDDTFVTDWWKLKDNSVDNSSTTAANAYIYPAGVNTTVSNNTGGEGADV